MVRVKHRYLVAQILYPERVTAPNAKPKIPSPTTAVTPEINRTLEFHRPTPAATTAASLSHLIRDTIAELFGEAGLGLCAGSLAIKYFSPATSTLIVRCARERARMVWAALTFITHLPGVQKGRHHGGGGGGGSGGTTAATAKHMSCVFRVLLHSGTMRKCEEKIIELARRDIRRVAGLDGDGSGDGYGDGCGVLGGFVRGDGVMATAAAAAASAAAMAAGLEGDEDEDEDGDEEDDFQDDIMSDED